jgi:tetratricopeptide (TPR) repeat protein
MTRGRLDKKAVFTEARERPLLWCRRRPGVAGLSAAALTALAGLAFGLWQWSAALRNARIADANAYVARVKSLQATTSARVSCNGVDDLMTNVAAVDLADIPQMAPVRILLLDKARDAYERLREENANRDDAELLWVSARAQGRLGDIQAMLGEFRDAEASYRDAIGRLESLAEKHRAGSHPGGDALTEGLRRDILRELVRNRLGFSVLLKDLYRLDEAGDQFRRAVACGQPLEASVDGSDLGLLAEIDCRRASLVAQSDGGFLAEIDYQRGVLLAREAELSESLPSPESPEFRATKEAYPRAIRRSGSISPR